MSNLLAKEFITARPGAAAKEIERFPLEQITELLTDLDAEIAGTLIARLNSALITELGVSLADKTLASILSVSSSIAVSAIIAHLNPDRYPAILNAATEQHKAMLSRLFRIEADTLSSYAMPLFISVAPEKTCAECKAELEASVSTTDIPIFAVDKVGQFLGLVPTFAILASRNADRQVSTLVEELAPLPGHARPESVLSMEQWDRHPILPVVDNRRRLVGAVARTDLLKMTRRSSSVMTPATTGLYNLVDVYFTLCADLLDLIIGNKAKW